MDRGDIVKCWRAGDGLPREIFKFFFNLKTIPCPEFVIGFVFVYEKKKSKKNPYSL